MFGGIDIASLHMVVARGNDEGVEASESASVGQSFGKREGKAIRNPAKPIFAFDGHGICPFPQLPRTLCRMHGRSRQEQRQSACREDQDQHLSLARSFPIPHISSRLFAIAHSSISSDYKRSSYPVLTDSSTRIQSPTRHFLPLADHARETNNKSTHGGCCSPG